ncbi:L-ascorbate oxidase homolog [Dendrobium catenatum]|uniref:L-ascorbate oxidase like n=1 Tax=Dendrobium catenatum TaxID=906689 RepID=A0A2I0VP01_9ASPA|nr:L-ascorbate oxidase homolog [Dendrobium catenatum]PKU65139.1 L-ascorbate oxidase like [Dendrobium catenatum]
MSRAATVLALLLSFFALSNAEDPYLFFTWNVTYGIISPMGVPYQAIMINGQFPGPVINCTSNNNIVINVLNNLDEPFLLSWNGIQHRKNSWQDGMPGTNCPIPPGQNFTYHWQPKDQIGTFFYFPSIGMHKAAGGYGLIRVHSRLLIPVPFDPPADEFDVLVSDWYGLSHKTLTRILDSSRRLSRARAVLINGAQNSGESPAFTFEAGKVYRFRVCNVGLKASLNLRIQGHKLKLVEVDGSHTMQNVYDNLDVHAGQCYSVLVTADQPPRDYYLVASTRFQKTIQLATAIIHYSGSNLPAAAELPPAPISWAWSLNQWRSFRWNLTASAARPNPQGSYHYGQINITRTIKLSSSTSIVDGKLRFALNGVSHRDSELPLKLAEYFGVNGSVPEYNQITDDPTSPGTPVKLVPNVITAEFRTFIEIIFENPETSIQSYHLDGYSFFPTGMGPGKWTPESRSTYNLLDSVSRHTIQVYPKSWTAIMLTFDNAGMWNLRSEIWDRRYLGQQLYISVLSPERSLRDEYNMPENALRCGAVLDLPLPKPYS